MFILLWLLWFVRLNVLLIMVIVWVPDLLRSLEGVIIARHVGHDRPLIRLRRVDQI